MSCHERERWKSARQRCCRLFTKNLFLKISIIVIVKQYFHLFTTLLFYSIHHHCFQCYYLLRRESLVFTLWCANMQIQWQFFEIFSLLLYEQCNSGNLCKSCNEGSDIGCNLQPVRIMRIACVNYSQHVKTCEISQFSELSATEMKLVKLAGVIIIINLIIRLRHCTMCTMVSIFTSQPNKLRPTVKVVFWYIF